MLDESFYKRTWSPESSPIADIVFIHGFAEHIDRYQQFFEFLAKKGLRIFAFDQRGFGKTAKTKSQYGVTGGWALALKDIDDAVLMTKKEGIPLFLQGHSMGGALVLEYAIRRPHRHLIDGYISMAPLIELSDTVSSIVLTMANVAAKMMGSFQLRNIVKPQDISRDQTVVEQYKNDPYVFLFIKMDSIDLDSLCHRTGTLKGVGDMLVGGMNLLKPESAKAITKPIVILHGDADKARV
ncbi:putative monoglyceride lipase [Neolecta irregularis DAH-3]|uniref:Putative monoglyceride lipase n=1 Tax=Neolecta irregularis (strain DAH-3) TaxID=1198029 RepID=A0A1U7LH41_NEOID|nr:putative monoglyceride lipase [Neolecta irregularis DAH-3]|eukprot:OLL21975.1 putative monoglyceride lipase [Neolecta irregularis DAH-3]